MRQYPDIKVPNLIWETNGTIQIIHQSSKNDVLPLAIDIPHQYYPLVYNCLSRLIEVKKKQHWTRGNTKVPFNIKTQALLFSFF